MNEIQKLYEEGILSYYINNIEIIPGQNIIKGEVDIHTHRDEIMEQLVADYIFEDSIYVIEE